VDASYNRDEWKHWSDEDGDCQDTRDEVLSRDGTGVSFNEGGCDVVSGSWYDPYTGKTFTSKSDVDIDHIVPLKDAHVSGGFAWGTAKKERYANYLDRPYHLIAVEDNSNQGKSDKSPDKWMPSNRAYQCDYVEHWVQIKAEWQLSMTRAEFDFINAKLHACEVGTSTNSTDNTRAVNGDGSEDDACCKVCKSSRACGDTCISTDNLCSQPPGCACQG
jgi:hypothetical protein